MKNLVISIVLFVVSLVIATEIVLLLVPGKTAPPPRREAANVDSSAVKQGKPRETTRESAPPEVPAVAAKDDSAAVHEAESGALRDSLARLRASLEAERQKPATAAPPVVDSARVQPAAAKENKTMAKLLDAMDAQGAARILNNMNDGEVKAVLLSVKKRQAGKILGSMDPERAARIMRHGVQ
jgi:flagellar motility protein MotE (MotC chaperone)